jgi:hypothetical protein
MTPLSRGARRQRRQYLAAAGSVALGAGFGVVVWRTGSLIATVAVGMAALLALGFHPRI